MGEPSELELLNGARAYDLPTLGDIYDRYSPGIYRYALRLTGDDCLAEDCLADTFMRFLKALQIGQGPRDHLQAYLYRIAHNWITDYYRRQPPPQLNLDETLAGDGADYPEWQAEKHLEQIQVRLAFRSLTPDQRQVIVLRFLDGWENAEVAAALQKPVGAIKALQHRALIMLRKQLLSAEKDGIDEPKPCT
ncbi:MAG TPA: sigma-70 family RNA polymerase sigma factor [Anaerolineales bacterium]|nr:sigma-70 family RNA polymerase sigma factor [Anaerolineales bacterium]